jgi:hypothetical protein
MNTSAILRDAFWYVEIALRAILFIRLLQLGLARRYAVLSAFLALTTVRSLVLAYLMRTETPVGWSGTAYGWVYVLTQPVIWAVYFLLILELYSRMLEEFPGVRRLGRVVLFSALGTATALCCALILIDRQAGREAYPFLSLLVLQERSVFLCLGALILLLLLFVSHYRLSIPRNVWVLVACFGGYFLANGALLTFRRYFGGDFAPLRNVISPLLLLSALSGALILLSKAGELETRPMSRLWKAQDPELEQTLAFQLRGFNRALGKVLNQ